MRNFHQRGAGIDVQPLMHQIMRHSELWNTERFRTTYTGTPHIDVDDILLRYSAPEKLNPEMVADVVNDTGAVWYPAANRLTEYKPIIRSLMNVVEGYSLERLLITRVRPGGRILRHADAAGAYVEMGDISRYHIVLQGLPGSMFLCGNEQVNMRTGEVWWFNAHEEHEVVNNSGDDRVHLMGDIRTMP